ncbi:hypothetical protein WICMUC_005203 [Wickerhamomyces mucosus]|uniref:Major facilitator superfamily (MFS) profile domain-containing protein n=1 Tax=Wickerhamomyces mucosus TaxID=1378264 RepID=A0A9P8T677_9ASCO|nr:hypothetical protein WICMUC_005203 [Wickerhamomyces mucosus]
MSYKTYNTSIIIWILALGGMLLGSEISSIAVFIGSSQFIEYFGNPSSVQQGMIGSSNPAGAFFGCWITGLISDKIGRIKTIRTGSILWVTGSFVSVLVIDLWMVVVGRAIKGLAVGIFSSILSVYISETLPDQKKSLATSAMQWSLTWGIMLMFYLSYICVGLEGDISFRIAWGMECIPGALLILFSILLPESPKWLASNGQLSKAIQICNEINSKATTKQNLYSVDTAGKNVSIFGLTSKFPKSNQNSLSQTSNLQKVDGFLDKFEGNSETCTYSDLFTTRLKYHLCVGIATQSLTQLSGISVLMYYLIFICEMIGMEENNKVFAASLQYVVNVLFTIFPIIWLDKLRRKDVLVFGTVSLGICISSIGGVMGFYGHESTPINGNESIVWQITGRPASTCLALCYLFVAIFASTLSCASWLYTSEIFPSRAKAKGSAICMSVSWCLNFLLTFTAPVALKSLKWGTFLVFGAFCLVGAFIIGFSFPETYGLKENEIEGLFNYQLKQNDIERNIEPSIGSKDHITEKGKAIYDNSDIDYRGVTLSSRKTQIQSNETYSNDQHEKIVVDISEDEKFPTCESRSKKTEGLKLSPGLNYYSGQSDVLYKNSSETADSPDSKALSNGTDVSPFLIKRGSPFEKTTSIQPESDEPKRKNAFDDTDHIQTPDLSEHYYNVKSNDSSFLKANNDSPFA